MVQLSVESQRWAAPSEPATGVVVRAAVQSTPIDVAEIEMLVDESAAGAVVTFVGRVRRHDSGRDVLMLEYSAHPSADGVALRIANETLAESVLSSSGVCAIALSHRVGPLEVGEIAVVCAVSAAHRAQAFDVCRDVVERIKHELPIWKYQVFADGTDEWVGCA